jgi:hypothetical protein
MKRILIITMFSALEFFATRATAETCAELATSLNRKMDGKIGSSYMDAGMMYEYGDCVEPDWEKAGQYYQRAAQAGIKLALPRLVALYAAQYRDPAAALWWAAQRPSMLPNTCVPGSNPLNSTEAFLSELRGWANTHLKACTYYAGVAARLSIHNTIDSAISQGLRISSYSVEINMSINVADGTIDFYDSENKRTVISRVFSEGLKPDLSSKPNRESGMVGLWHVGVDALKEFGKPPPSDSVWSHKSSFVVLRNFSDQHRRIELDLHQ